MLRRAIPIITATILTIASAGCSGGASGDCNPEGLAVNSIDGTAGASLTATFDYTFDAAADTSTVTTSTYFIREAPAGGTVPAVDVAKAEIDEMTCDVTKALEATVSCSRSTHCTLDPASDLNYNARYVICLTTGISLADGTSFGGFMASFTTEEDPSAFTEPSPESLSFAAYSDSTGQAMFTVGSDAYLINGSANQIMKLGAGGFATEFTSPDDTLDLLATYSTQVLDGKAYIFGGLKHDGVCTVTVPTGASYDCATGDTWVYDPVLNTLTLTGATLSEPRDVAASGVVNGKIYIIGGWYPNAVAENISTVEAFDGTSWSTVETTGDFIPVRSPAFATVGTKIYIIGGCTQTCQETMVQIFDASTNTFSSGASMSLSGRHFSGQHAVARQDRYIYVFGGATDLGTTKYADAAVYDTQANEWQTLTETMTVERKSVGSTVAGDLLYIAGGGYNTVEVGTFVAQ